MKNRLKKCIGISIWGVLFELLVFAWYKDFTYYNYASIPPTYVFNDSDDDIRMETFEIPVSGGDYILELSYKCTVETEWQLVDANDMALYQGVLDPAQTKLQRIFEVSGSVNDEDNESDSIRFIITYAKEGTLSIESFVLNKGTENVLTLQGKDFYCSDLGFQDGTIETYYKNVGSQEFYGLNPYHEIVIQNNTADILYFDLNNCQNYEDPENIITAKKLGPDESWSYRYYDPISYQAVFYSPSAELQDISVQVDNKAYMGEYKTAVIFLMGIVATLTALMDILVLAGICKVGKKYWEIAAVLIHVAGILFYVIQAKPYIVNACLFISIFMMAASLFLIREDAPKEYCQEYNSVYAGIVTVLFTAGLYVAILNSRRGSILSYLSPVSGRGLLLYFLFVISSILLFILCANLINKHNAIFRKLNQYIGSKESLLLGIMTVDFLIKDHVGTALTSEWRRWQMILVLAMLAAITIYLYKAKQNTDHKDWAVKALYLLEIITVWINKTLINIYGADSLTFGETHHISAYYDEITYIAKGEPFRGGGSELYGHYALFWRLPMMIFGNNLKVVGIVSGIVAAVTFFFLLLTVQRTFHIRFVRVMVSLSLWCILISGGSSSFSSVPHRYVIFSILLYFMVRWQKEELSVKKRLIGHLLCVLALVWNTESGLCLSLAWAVYIVVREIENKDSCLWLAVKKMLIQIVFVIVEIILFFGSIELYNKTLCNHKDSELEISVQSKNNIIEISGLMKSVQRESVESDSNTTSQGEEQESTEQGELENIIVENTGVLFDSGYMGANMNGVYHFENTVPFSIMVFIVITALYFLSGTGIVGKTRQIKDTAVALAVCVFGLGLISYSATRGFSDTGKIVIPFLLLFFIMLEKAIGYMETHPREYALKNNIVYLMSFFMMIGLVQMELNCFFAVRNFDILLNEKNILDYESMQKDMEQFANLVPEGSYAYGNGIAEIYMSIGREMSESSNTQYIVTDGWRGVEDMPYVKIRDIQIGRYVYTLYYNQGYK